ncbi:prolyl aminopeptidase (secreted) [Fusarium sp. NRRL 25303]|nr:prolyl aminopeptidase (secreted) [Fusarium sp. NRRL 25303]
MAFLRGALAIALSLLLASTDASSPRQVASFNVTPEIGEKYGCGARCQAIVNMANAADLDTIGAMFDQDWYATPINFTSSSKPGDLLKIESMKAADLGVRYGTSVFRFQYTTRDLDGSSVPTSGIIAFPFSVPASGRFRPVVYGHSSIGVSYGCAPSNSPSLFEARVWGALIDRGYAIIAPDYAGLGNNYTIHKFSNLVTHANDIYYAMVAARNAFPNTFTNEWMSVGVFQGAAGIWKLAELPIVQKASSGYLGGVAIDPPSRQYDYGLYSIDHIFSKPDCMKYGATAEIPFSALTVKRTYPEYDYAMLGPTLKKRMGLIEELQLCTNAILSLVLDLEMPEILSFDGTRNDKIAQKFQKEYGVSNGDTAATPLWVASGENDTFLQPYAVTEPARLSCSYGNSIDLRMYPGLDHEPTTAASTPEWTQWIADQFNRVHRRHGCTNITQTPFNLDTASTIDVWGEYLALADSVPSDL